jgi:hypothetical protein
MGGKRIQNCGVSFNILVVRHMCPELMYREYCKIRPARLRFQQGAGHTSEQLIRQL